MKKTKSRLFKLAFLLLTLLFLYILKIQFANFFSQKTPFVFPDLKNQSISHITIIGGKSISLYKKNGLWFVKQKKDEFRADQERINNLINNIINLKKEEIVSTNKTKHQQFGIDKEKISFKINDKDFVVFIGKTTGLNKNYLRVDKQNEVFIGEGLTDVFYPDDYRDLNVYLVDDENKVVMVKIAYDNKTLVLQNKNDKWYLKDKEIKKEKVSFFINELKTLKADDILPKKTSPSTIAELIINLKENRREKTANFYQQDEDNYLLKISTSELIYQISKNTVDSLKKQEQDFTK